MRQLLKGKCTKVKPKVLYDNVNILELYFKFSEELVEVLGTDLQSTELHLVVKNTPILCHRCFNPFVSAVLR